MGTDSGEEDNEFVFDFNKFGNGIEEVLEVLERMVNEVPSLSDEVEPIVIDESKAGLFWYTDKYEIIVSKINDAGGPFEDHYTTWYRLKNSGSLKMPYSEAEWDFYKRGRVVYDPWEGKGVFSVYSGESCSNGKCSNDKFVGMVIKEYKLKDNVRWFYSSHYDRSKDMASFNIDGSEIEDN